METQNRRQFLTTSGGAFCALSLGLGACGEGRESDRGQTADEGTVSGGRLENTVYGDVVLGEPAAPVEIIEYASMTCGACAHFHTNIFPELKAKYIDTGKVRFILRNFVTNSVDLSASMVARCGGEDKFYALIDLMFAERDKFLGGDPVTGIADIVRRAGLSRTDVDSCLQDKELQKAIIISRDEGAKQYNVNRTPTFVVNREEIIVGAGSIEEFDRVLAGYL